MNDARPSPNQALPVATLQPRWRLSVRDIFFLTTLLATVLALTHWLSRGFRTTQADLLPMAILFPVCMTIVLNTVSYWIARTRGGTLVCWLKLQTSLARWCVLLWTPISAGVGVYLALRFFSAHPDAPFISTIILWLLATGSALNIVSGSLRLQVRGIVASPGLVWILSPWQRCREVRLSWKFDCNGNLVLGHGWARVVAEVPPEQREVVDHVLNEKLWPREEEATTVAT